MNNKRDVVIVTGDVTIDWNLVRFRAIGKPSAIPGWWTEERTQLCCQRGGAAMLASLIETLAEPAGFEVRKMAMPPGPIHPADKRFHHSYALWYQEGQGDDLAWRVQEFLGLNRSSGDSAQDWQKVQGDPPDASVVVLDDAGLGFRSQRELWPRAIANPESDAWIVVKMARPVADGLLWEELCNRCRQRLIVVMNVNDLRLTEVQISRQLSWERTAQDIYWELANNPRVQSLSECAHVIVSFYTDGALLLSRPAPDADLQCTLFFDPDIGEGMWRRQFPGKMIGYTTCLTASIVWQALRNPPQPNLGRAIESGVAAMRLLHQTGYDAPCSEGDGCDLAFPAQTIAEKIMASEEEKPELVTAEVEDPVQFLDTTGAPPSGASRGRLWTILEARYAGSLDQVAADIVRQGPEQALEGVPLGRFGKLLTVDRREIESYRSIQAVLAEYCAQPRQRPISVAVFGPPGAGKSFGVKQVAEEIKPGQVQVLTFNLSQFGGPHELSGAFHQVRDVGLSGQIPLVFWDEFDSRLDGQQLGWLRYFLAPMQDGTFQEGQITHPIGQAIFVFAGGTSHSVNEFIVAATQRGEASRNVKGPDFVSRLKGYVNVMGPNPLDVKYPEGDPAYLIRRAIILRILLERAADHLFEQGGGKGALNIDEGVLLALLHVRKYKHGVRSMEAIIAMSTLVGKSRFERSCLPSEAQLDLHVDGIEFLALVQHPKLEGELLERLARAVHEVYCENQRDKPDAPEAAFQSFDELSPHMQRQNRDYVLDIRRKLAVTGYVMIPARSNAPPFGFPGSDLELLAEMEHERWMRAKLADGWRYGPERDEKEKTNPALVPWRKLTEEEKAQLDPAIATKIGPGPLSKTEKDKDYALVRDIPKILARGGYTIVKLHHEQKRG
ncbi:MAG: hypothetical protein AMJ93_10690 [Anaerolineae bacterium SM23_84]|nr:MAG: hypothetical protein AMJ93_10690 [Anaerolineae bacterium SM23_84]